MSEEFSISLEKTIVHILDNNLHLPVLSDEEHPLDDDINEFIENHVFKILKDDNLKTAHFIGEENRLRDICTAMSQEPGSFTRLTQETAGVLFELMQKHVDIPSADLICCLLELDGSTCLGILKLNYKSSYIHYVQANESSKINSIVKQKTALPGDSQKVDECALINLVDLSIKLLEKKYEVNGEKLFYFSSLFLNCATDISSVQKAKVFKRAAEDFNKKYLDQDVTTSAEIRKAVTESIYEKETIDIEDVAENVFRENPEMQKSFVEHIEKSGLRDKTIKVDEEFAEKTFKRQKIKTDNGIEINLPVEYYKDRQKVEFINNIDGTISIIIKNIGKIIDIK